MSQSAISAVSSGNVANNSNEPLEADPATRLRLVQARAHVDAKRFDDAVSLYSQILDDSVPRYGDELSIHLAPLYFEYGRTLLQQAQEAFDMFGSKASTSRQYEESTDSPHHETSSKSASDSTVSVPEITQDEADDRNELLEIAWETLETAKNIYSRSNEPEHKGKLIDVMERLADISLENEQFSSAISDYTSALEMLENNHLSDKRREADLHAYIGLANILAADEADETEAKSMLCASRMHYRKAIEALFNHMSELLASSATANTLSAKLKECKEKNDRSIERGPTESLGLSSSATEQDNIKIQPPSLESFAEVCKADNASTSTTEKSANEDTISPAGEITASAAHNVLEIAECLDGLYEKLTELLVDPGRRKSTADTAKKAAEQALLHALNQASAESLSSTASMASLFAGAVQGFANTQSSQSSTSATVLQPRKKTAGSSCTSQTAQATSTTSNVETHSPPDAKRQRQNE